MRIGYFLSCEGYSPRQLLEQAGFEGLWIGDHFLRSLGSGSSS